ncbi:MAG: arginine deiminase family protein [Candidatus Hodarchaeales archaeon]|jgi:arginine deiminase
MEFGATCEYSPLDKVMLFKPGEELQQLNVDNYDELSFRDVVYWRRFQEEHNQFCNVLKEEQVKIVYLNDLITPAQQSLIDPNMVYIRDTSAILPTGYIQMRMKHLVRLSEPTIVAEALEKYGIPSGHKVSSPDFLEGGDFVFPDAETAMIGFGTRSSEKGLNKVSDFLFKAGIKTIIHVPLPPWRVHLDGGLMFVNKNVILFHPASVTTHPARLYREGEPMELISLIHFLSKEFGVQTIPITDNELYLFGANVVCLNDKKCVIYEWNERIIKELEQFQIEAIPIAGSELSRGGGGPHCMTLPLLRRSF